MKKFVHDCIDIIIPFAYVAGFIFNAILVGMVDNRVDDDYPGYQVFLYLLMFCLSASLIAVTHIGLRRLKKTLSE